MPKINLIQNTPEWLEYRKNKLMASEISSIMGSNPWKNASDLWKDKLGMNPAIKMNAAMQRGHDLEPEARKLFNELTLFEMIPCVYESDKYPWAAASLDGMTECGTYILEIKCPKEKSHLECCASDTIAPYYIDQCQHQLMVTGAKMCYYFSYRPEWYPKYAIVEIKPDYEYHKKIIDKEYAFYLSMCNFDEPKTWTLDGK